MVTPFGSAEVTDTLKPSVNLTVHQITVKEGSILLDSEVTLRVEEGLRMASARNHTCTHLLHAALQAVLGSHARQAGSLVSPERLRFDFTHISAMTDEEIAEVERRVNAAILADRPLEVAECSYDEAVAGGAMALFGEKYESKVRVVRIEGESSELCGGTHLTRTGQAGFFNIISESGVAAGVRRIEAATGWNSIALFNAQRSENVRTAALLKVRPGEIASRVETLQHELRAARKNLERATVQAASSQGRDLLGNLETIKGVGVLTARSGVSSIKALRDLMDDVRSKLSSGICCLTSEDEEGKVSLLLFVSKDLHGRFTAPALIKEAAAAIGGSGGGRADLAQAGGSNPAGLQAAFAKLIEQINN
jgi:alanyl-tRNA synthetase